MPDDRGCLGLGTGAVFKLVAHWYPVAATAAS
jgi:hypothetical protein